MRRRTAPSWTRAPPPPPPEPPGKGDRPGRPRGPPPERRARGVHGVLRHLPEGRHLPPRNGQEPPAGPLPEDAVLSRDAGFLRLPPPQQGPDTRVGEERGGPERRGSGEDLLRAFPKVGDVLAGGFRGVRVLRKRRVGRPDEEASGKGEDVEHPVVLRRGGEQGVRRGAGKNEVRSLGGIQDPAVPPQKPPRAGRPGAGRVDAGRGPHPPPGAGGAGG